VFEEGEGMSESKGQSEEGAFSFPKPLNTIHMKGYYISNACWEQYNGGWTAHTHYFKSSMV
jgi:hypothetical protein